MTGETLTSQPKDPMYHRIILACGPNVSRVDETYQLLDASSHDIDMEEFYSGKFNTRFLAIPSESPMAHTHAQLAEARLPVFSALGAEGILLLTVPEGSLSLRKTLPALARGVGKYNEIFEQVGRTLAALEQTGFGTFDTTGAPFILDRLAFAADVEQDEGWQLFMVPPYEFTPHGTAEQAREQLRLELLISQLFSNAEVDYLMDQIEYGQKTAG